MNQSGYIKISFSSKGKCFYHLYSPAFFFCIITAATPYFPLLSFSWWELHPKIHTRLQPPWLQPALVENVACAGFSNIFSSEVSVSLTWSLSQEGVRFFYQIWHNKILKIPSLCFQFHNCFCLKSIFDCVRTENLFPNQLFWYLRWILFVWEI